MFFLVVNALNCGYFLGLNPVVWYSFLEGELDICFFVTLRIATVLRVQHGVLALFVLPAFLFFVLVHSGVMVFHAIGRVRRMPWASRARVALPPNPLHPGHDPAVGWAIFFKFFRVAATISLLGLFLDWTLPLGGFWGRRCRGADCIRDGGPRPLEASLIWVF